MKYLIFSAAAACLLVTTALADNLPKSTGLPGKMGVDWDAEQIIVNNAPAPVKIFGLCDTKDVGSGNEVAGVFRVQNTIVHRMWRDSEAVSDIYYWTPQRNGVYSIDLWCHNVKATAETAQIQVNDRHTHISVP